MKPAATLSLIALAAFACAHAIAQVTLPDVTVREKKPDELHGGYAISGDFQVDPRMNAVIFPIDPLEAGDILSAEPQRLADDEYLVLQECVSDDCTHAQNLRVWFAHGATTQFHNANRYMITHEGKYFIWMARIQAGAAPPEAGQWFNQFEKFTTPLVLIPEGLLAAYSKPQIEAAEHAGPVPVKSAVHEGSMFVATFATGSVVRIKRLRAAG